MSSRPEHNENLPYYPNNRAEKLQMFGDISRALLENYGEPNRTPDGTPTREVSWEQQEIQTAYHLVGPDTVQSLRELLPDLFQFTVTVTYPDHQISKRMHVVNSTKGTRFCRILKMTEDESIALVEAISKSPDPKPGYARVLPPRKDSLDPEHELEILLSQLSSGFDSLSKD